MIQISVANPLILRLILTKTRLACDVV